MLSSLRSHPCPIRMPFGPTWEINDTKRVNESLYRSVERRLRTTVSKLDGLVSKQRLLGTRGTCRVPEVIVGELAGDAAARSALQKSDLNEVGLVKIFDRAAVFADR